MGVELADAESRRQLEICDACRFCEGICAVFPALERRGPLSDGDIVQLAHLCHDCGACLAVCPYAPPHLFAVNLPQLFAARRVDTVRSLGAHALPAPPDRRRSVGVLVAILAALVAVVVGVVLTHDQGVGEIVHGSPYRVVEAGYLVMGSAIATGIAVVILAVGGHRFWRAIGGQTRDLLDVGSVVRGVTDGAVLRNLDGGGVPCTPGPAPVGPRRLLHHLVVAGFALTVVATVAAAVSEDLLSHPPPYRWWSLPVAAGAVGGILLLVGCVSFRVIGAQRDPAAIDPEAHLRNGALLDALATLAVTGLLALVARRTAAGAVLLIVHLVAVWSTIVIAAWSKFAHAEYRLLALIWDHIERRRERLGESER